LDFDQAAVGEPAVDLGNFVAHLEREALEGRIPAERIEEMTSALLQGYGRPVSIEAWTALALFLLSTDPFRQRETDWPERMAAILDRATAILHRSRVGRVLREKPGRRRLVEYEGGLLGKI